VTDLRGKALVVEDDASSRGIFERRLRALGMEVVTAGDGEEGLALARREAPAIILADIKMPRMDGLEMLKALRREGIETTVIVITAFGTIESAVEAMKAGAYDFITKPFDPKHLELVVAKALERGRLLDANRLFRDEQEARLPPLVGRPTGGDRGERCAGSGPYPLVEQAADDNGASGDRGGTLLGAVAG